MYGASSPAMICVGNPLLQPTLSGPIGLYPSGVTNLFVPSCGPVAVAARWSSGCDLLHIGNDSEPRGCMEKP
jgi:hypothetical protein